MRRARQRVRIDVGGGHERGGCGEEAEADDKNENAGHDGCGDEYEYTSSPVGTVGGAGGDSKDTTENDRRGRRPQEDDENVEKDNDLCVIALIRNPGHNVL